MSLTSAFNTASSGLTVALKAAGVASSNIANALSEGYAKRELSIETFQDGGAIAGRTSRLIDQRTLAQLRIFASEQTGADTQSKANDEVERLWGTSDTPGSIPYLTTEFEANLVALGADPKSLVKRNLMLETAGDLVQEISTVEKGIQDIRQNADNDIARAVQLVNNSLVQIAQLNSSIAKFQGANTAAMEDKRQALIDKIAEIIPVKTIARKNGVVALLTPKGQFLLDGRAQKLEFQTGGMITAAVSLENGQLNLPSINNTALYIPDEGRLAALIKIRDTVGPEASNMIASLASTLADRIPDVFELSTSPLAPNTLALAANADQHDADSGLAALTANAPSPFGPNSLSDFIADISSTFSTNTLNAEERLASASAKVLALQEANADQMVDTDLELRDLVEIEKTYAANAKVLQAVSTMLDELLSIG